MEGENCVYEHYADRMSGFHVLGVLGCCGVFLRRKTTVDFTINDILWTDAVENITYCGRRSGIPPATRKGRG